MTYQLRPYQSQSLFDLRSAIARGVRAAVLMMPCGAGKTSVAAEIMAGAVRKGKRAYFVVDSKELLDQAADRFEAEGLEVGIIQGQNERTDYGKPVQVATIQTLRNRWEQIAASLRPNVIVIDEAHVLHQAHEEIVAWAKEHKVPVIGLSATPWRKGLGLHFDDMIIGITTAELVEKGYLVPSICYAPRIPNLDAVKTRSDGDWQEDALAEVMGDAALMGDIVQHWYRHARDRKTLVFATNVAHSRALCDAFLKAGIAAAHIDGYERDPEVREQIIDDFRSGKTQVLVNVAILTKGFDCPETSCLVLARPTKSLMLHYQILGRGLRTFPGKEDCLILDHAGNCLRNGVPEDRVPATLDDGKNGRQLDRKQSEPTEPVAKPCSSCGHVSKLHKCPACGFAPERREDVEVKDGELYPITKRQEPKWQPADVRNLYAELLGHAQLKGYKAGWAWHKCREFTGTAPRDKNQIEPRHPGDKTLGMIKHMQIKKAKAKAKAQQQGVPA